MEQIYKMAPSSTFEPVKVAYQPYVDMHNKYCTTCGEANTIQLKAINQFSPITGNEMFYLYYVCSNGHEGKSFSTVYRWKQDKCLYTGNFEDPQEYIDQLTDRRKQ